MIKTTVIVHDLIMDAVTLVYKMIKAKYMDV